MSLGKRLLAVRGNMNQRTFGEMHGVSQRTYARYERDEDTPDGVFLASVCSRHGVNPAWLLLGEGPMRPVGTAPPAYVSPLDQDLLHTVLAGVKKGLALRGTALPPDKEAELVVLLYDYYAKTRETPDEKTVERYLRLVA